jgi:hypothetical protein
MRTPLQIAASRANGSRSRGPKTPEGKRISAANAANSTGPVTPEGKAVSSGNATRHGLLADSILVDGESEQAFLETLTRHEKVFQPADEYENMLVEMAAVASWRLQRAWSLEKAQYIRETMKRQRAAAGLPDEHSHESAIMKFEAGFRALADTSNAGVLCNRYEARLNRTYFNAIRYLENYRLARSRGKKARKENYSPKAA